MIDLESLAALAMLGSGSCVLHLQVAKVCLHVLHIELAVAFAHDLRVLHRVLFDVS